MRLAPEERREVANFALFLISRREDAAADEDAAWEETIAHGGPFPKLDAFMQQALAEEIEPLDPDRL